MEKMRYVYRILVGTLQGKGLLGRHRHRKDIEIDLKEIGCEVVDWIHVAQDRKEWRRAPVNTLTKLGFNKM
jgi:hypothetical protein